MMVLACDTCDEVMHRVPKITEQSKRAGADQLVRHAMEHHVLFEIEGMLRYTAQLNWNMARIMESTRITCMNCEDFITEDSYLYVRKDGRTRHLCSQKCLDQVT